MELCTKSDFSKRAGISRAMTSKLIKGRLSASIIDGKINIDSECVAEYARDRNVDVSNPRLTPSDLIDLTNSTNITPETITIKGGDDIIPADTDVANFETMTLAQLCGLFGTDERFKVWLSGRKTIIDIKCKELTLAKDKGELINRTLVKNHLIDTFNSAHLRLMKDGAKSIAAGVVSKHASGADIQEIENFVSDIVGSFIKPVKNKITRVLRNA